MVVIEGIRINVVSRSKGRNTIEYNSTAKTILLKFPCNNVHNCTPYKVTLPTGIYRFELWGAQGGYSRYVNKDELNPLTSGKGAYTAGTMKFLTESNLFFYIGGMGENQTSIKHDVSLGGYNGGGNGGVDLADPEYPESSSGGGGSTDIRIIKGDTLSALKSRIIVAAGGGGSSSTDSVDEYSVFLAGDGGTLSGTTHSKYSIPGNQTYGMFGKGANGFSFSGSEFDYGGSTGGSGGGYYGGITTHPAYGANLHFNIAAAGGSSYISGYNGCNSVNFDASDTITHSGSPIHYTQRVFDNPVMMMNRDTSFISPYGLKENGHFGNGAIKIKIIARFASVTPFKTCAYTRRKYMPSIYYAILIYST